MFVSRKKLMAIETKIDNRAHVADVEFWRRACMELQARVQSLEEALGMVYQSRPHKVFHAKKGGPELAE